MQEYECVYITGVFATARRVYHAGSLAEAMAVHNAAMPAHRDQVLKWIGPTGIRFLFHDAKLTLD